MIAEAKTELIEDLLKKPPQANINHVNKYGMTALMLACRLKDVKLIHVLMRNNASLYQTAGK